MALSKLSQLASDFRRGVGCFLLENLSISATDPPTEAVAANMFLQQSLRPWRKRRDWARASGAGFSNLIPDSELQMSFRYFL